MPIAQFPAFVIDCPDARVLADFYGALLDWEAKGDAEWAEIRPEDGSACISFQQVADFRAPQWPGQEHPQQMHLDVVVDDLDAAEQPAADLGAAKHDHQPKPDSFRVFLDPAGHPFCLCAG
jgi:hypothetical protein